MIRVLIADDHTLMRSGLRALLERAPDIRVIGEASDGREKLALIQEHLSDVVLMDVADILGISVKTVETHRYRLMDRLNIHHITGLVRYAIKTGLVQPEE